MTFPLVFKISEEIPIGGDAYYNLWNLWWYKKEPFNPYYTNYIFYPQGVSLAFADLSPLNCLISIPFQIIFGVVVSNNLLFLFSFVCSAFGMYLLSYYLTKDHYASFIAGLIFSFSPFHFARMGHIQLFSYQWIPFFVLYFLRMLKEKTMKNTILASIFLIFAALTTWYFMLFLFIFIAIFLVYYRKEILSKQFLRLFFLMLILFSLVVFPFLLPMIIEQGYYAKKGIETSVLNSADLAAFFVPSPYHPLFDESVSIFYDIIQTYREIQYGINAESIVFLGFTTMLLSFYAIKKSKKTKFWLITSLIFLVLSLGPVLRFFGLVEIPIQDIGLDGIVKNLGLTTNTEILNSLKDNLVIPLPYLVLYFFPFIGTMSGPNRLIVMIILSLSILVGFGTSFMLKSKKLLKFFRNKNFLVSLIIFLILFEFASFPLPLASTEISYCYDALTLDKEDYAIVELPLADVGAKAFGLNQKIFMYYQTIHEKKLISGLTSRFPGMNSKFLNETENTVYDFIHNNDILTFLANPENETLEQTIDVTEEKNLLRDYDIRYIIYHKELAPCSIHEYFSCSFDEDAYRDILKPFLDENFEIYCSDNKINVYRIN